ncbi:MAG: site-2 protease family protein [Christensenellaceae bacterium]|jgi:Zn-dependent protease|nr:site-2 protease family protein [Christensenellaceae bacterium]
MFFWNIAQSLKNGASISDTIVMILAFICVVAFSISFHEFAHAYVAYRCGDDTAKIAGRMTLNPIKHFDLVGILMFLIVGFGYAKPVPVNSYNFNNYKKGRIAVSLAGITANLILASLGILFLFLVAKLEVNISTGVPSKFVVVLINFLFYFCIYMVLSNFMLAFFNLLPIAPLDGFNFLASILPSDNKFLQFMHQYGRFVLYGIILLSWASRTISAYVPILRYLDIFSVFGDLILDLIAAIIL